MKRPEPPLPPPQPDGEPVMIGGGGFVALGLLSVYLGLIGFFLALALHL